MSSVPGCGAQWDTVARMPRQGNSLLFVEICTFPPRIPVPWRTQSRATMKFCWVPLPLCVLTQAGVTFPAPAHSLFWMLARIHICFLWDLEFFHSFSQAPLPTIWLPVHRVVGLYSNLTQLPWLFLLLWAATAIYSLPALGLFFDLSYNCPQASVWVHS